MTTRRSTQCAPVSTQQAPPRPVDGRRLVGRRGEDLAQRYVRDLGWQVLARNWRHHGSPRGELDLVAVEPGQGGGPGVLVVIEVKTRTSVVAGFPAEAVGYFKQRRLRQLAAAWLGEHRPGCGLVRIDVISILLRDPRPALLSHHRGALGWPGREDAEEWDR